MGKGNYVAKRKVPNLEARMLDGALDFTDDKGKTEEHLCKQSFKNESDINQVLARAERGASLSHLANHQGTYGDFSDWDENTYQTMMDKVARAQSTFYDLPAEIRFEFNNDPARS